MTTDFGTSIEQKRVLIRGISLPFTADPREALRIAEHRICRYIPVSCILSSEIYKRSVDARHNNEIRFIYTVAVSIGKDVSLSGAEAERDIKILDEREKPLERGDELLSARPVVIGFGPAGIFASLMLAEYGYRPLVLERGASVDKRQDDVERFYREGVLNVCSNIQFGAGGAGTFSDGKLTTRIGDERCRRVLRILHELGAPEDIMTNAKPHIGTENLRIVVKNAEKYIISRGGEIRYGVTAEKLPDCGRRVNYISTNMGDIPCGAVILAIGHSARDTYMSLIRSGYTLFPKPFSMGVRVEHLQSDIDSALYGKYAGDKRLPPAEYNVSRRFGNRAVYTFCMCPGGEVVAAASEEGGLVVNGMSNYLRNGKNANSAVALSLEPLSSPEAQIALQRRFEGEAFKAGGCDYRAPIQTMGDFLSGGCKTEPTRVQPTYMRGTPSDPKTKVCDLSALISGVLGDSAVSMLREGFGFFGKHICGFDMPEAVLTGVESRTSAPVRILRDETLTARGSDNLYPCGEGAGYAGGIMSAAVDGIRCASAVIERYSPEYCG